MLRQRCDDKRLGQCFGRRHKKTRQIPKEGRTLECILSNRRHGDDVSASSPEALSGGRREKAGASTFFDNYERKSRVLREREARRVLRRTSDAPPAIPQGCSTVR